MRYRKNGNLIPLATIANKGNSIERQEMAIQERLSQSWILVVGPILVHQTRLIRIHRGTMLIGCWHYDIINSLRQSAEVTWPKIQARLAQLWKIKLHSVEIVPCDPPNDLEYKPKIDNDTQTDSFMEVLNLLLKQNKSFVDHRVRMQ